MHKPRLSNNHLGRRSFLQKVTLASASLAAFPALLPAVRGENAPSKKLNLAGIGIGGQGASDLREMASQNIVALCDVDKNHAAGTFKAYPKAKPFVDFRKMLDEMKEIDAVVIATPDHLHAFAAMEAMRRGKHVYCEKPLTHSVWEARQLAQAARHFKVVTQMGNQGQATDATRRLCELVWSGIIGPIREVHVWTDRPSRGLFDEYWPQGVNRPSDTPKAPADLDWDLWIGPAPMRPYHPAYHPFRWRGWWDFGTGALGDIGCHALDSIFRALKLGAPLSIQAASTRANQDSFPLGSMVTFQFPERDAAVQEINRYVTGKSGKEAGGFAMPPVKLVWYDGGLRPARPASLPDGTMMGDNGRLLIGDDGFILNQTVFPSEKAKAAAEIPSTLPKSIGHYEEFLNACRGGAPAGANFDWAGPLAESVLLGNVALRVQLREELTLRSLQWNSAEMKVTNMDDANQFVRREYRPGWSLDMKLG